LERGEIVYLDVGCRANGYCSDVSRSVVLGELPPSHERIRQSVLDGYWSTINTLRPGVGIREVFKNAIDMVRRAGIPDFMRSNVGHGIGLSIHELPDMVSSSSGLLEKDMVLNIETPYHGIGIGGFQQEDTARITHGGVELLTKLDRDVRLPA
jgi:Xaa-Pro dipeptidase